MRFKIFIIFLMSFPSLLWATLPHKSHSVLESGKWYRISVQKQGIYKITYDDFVAMGFDPATIDPAKISVFGNGGSMLPEPNAAARPDDLIENAILVHDGGDGKLDPGDYILFYGESPDKWTLNYITYHFKHQKNIYSDSSFYYVTVGTNPGKRIQQVPSLTDSAHSISRRFVDHAFHEIDSVNLTQSGKTWVGETFTDFQNSRNITFDFPHIDSTVLATVTTHILATSTSPSSFLLSDNLNFNQQINLSALDPSSDTFANDSTKYSLFTNPTSHMGLKMSFRMNEPSATGWLDYIEVSCRRELVFMSPQMTFRDLDNIHSPNNEFRISGSDKSVFVWDVTKTGDAAQILPLTTDDSTMLIFRAPNDSLREYIAFDGSSFYPVHLSGPVTNQDLHGLAPTDLVIVTPSLFIEQADSLADFHRTHGGLSVTVVDLNQIFNEFGCGQRDPTAVRDFMKMLYDKGSPDNSPSYLLTVWRWYI
jgi:hypothetical protein